MFFVTTSPPHMSLAGAAAPSLPSGVTLDGMQMMADGSAAAGVRAPNSAMNPSVNSANAANSTAPPSYEAIVLDPNGPRSQTNLFVRKLASAVKEKDLKTMFERYGAIMSFALMRDIHTGESLGTAFVRYRTHEEARAAMTGLDGTELYGRPISIQWAKKEHDGTPCGDARRKIHKLFVRNIPLTVTARHLRQVFSQFGSINNVTLHSDTAPAVPRDAPADAQAGQMRNIAFILFQEDGAAERAVSALHNTCPFPSCDGIPLMVKLAEDNRDRLGRKQKADPMLNPAAAAPIMIAANGQPATLSTPLSTTISPAQLSLDPGAAHVLGATMLPSNIAPGMQFSMAPNGTSAAPMLQATTDANGNTTYVYVTAPTTAGPRMITPPAPGPYFVQTPAGLQAFSAPMQPAQMPAYYTTTAATSPAGGALPSAMQTPQQAYFPSMAVSPMFVDAQGNPVTPMQQNIIMPGFYPSFTPQQLLAQQQQLMMQQQMAQSQSQSQATQQPQMAQQPQPQPQQTPTQKRLSLPSLAEVAATAGQTPQQPPMTMTPLNAPFMKGNSSAGSKNLNERSPGAQLLSQGPHPDILSNRSVSPQLSSTASNTNLVPTAGSSVVVTPTDGGMAVPTNTLQPASGALRTLVPMTAVAVSVSPNSQQQQQQQPAPTNAGDGDDEHPLFNYDALNMEGGGNSSLTAASSMTVTNDFPVSALHLGIEAEHIAGSGSKVPAAARLQAAKH